MPARTWVILNEDFSSFPQSLLANVVKTFRSDDYHFISNPLQFIIHETSYCNSTLHGIAIESVVKISPPQKEFFEY